MYGLSTVSSPELGKKSHECQAQLHIIQDDFDLLLKHNKSTDRHAQKQTTQYQELFSDCLRSCA